MQLITRYVREGLLYSENELMDILNYSSVEELNKFLSMMKKYRIVKTKRFNSYQEDASILDDEDDDYIEVNDNEQEVKYLFRYVGVVYAYERLLKIYPKYISSTEEPRLEMEQIISVLKKYKSSNREKIEYFSDSSGSKKYDTLSILLYIMDDYVNNGLYINDQDIINVNGNGEILWQKTVDETLPIALDDSLYYLDLYTREQTINENDYFMQLHQIIVSEASAILEATDIADMFYLPRINLTDREIDSLGDTEYILDKIDVELGQQFDDRKKNLLWAMREYVSRSGRMLLGDDKVLFYGTRSFNLVWEKVINSVYINQSDMSFGEIKNKYVHTLDYSILMPNGKEELISATMSLDSAIEKPEWYIKTYMKSLVEERYLPQKTFVPDYLSFGKSKEAFYILDAKYYVPVIDIMSDGQKVIKKQPGVEDVAKQYMYYLVYKNLLNHNGIDTSRVKNYFIMPSEDEDKDMGYAKLGIFESIIPNVFDIRIKRLNAGKLFQYYLNDETLLVDSIP